LDGFGARGALRAGFNVFGQLEVLHDVEFTICI